jgi:hypothetical protein
MHFVVNLFSHSQPEHGRKKKKFNLINYSIQKNHSPITILVKKATHTIRYVANGASAFRIGEESHRKEVRCPTKNPLLRPFVE